MNTYRRAAAAFFLTPSSRRAARALSESAPQGEVAERGLQAGDGQVGLELGLVRVGRRGGPEDVRSCSVAGRVGSRRRLRPAGSWAGTGCAGLHISEYAGIHTYLLLGL